MIDDEGEGRSIIEKGRFVLPGTEELNRPFRVEINENVEGRNSEIYKTVCLPKYFFYGILLTQNRILVESTWNRLKIKEAYQ